MVLSLLSLLAFAKSLLCGAVFLLTANADTFVELTLLLSGNKGVDTVVDTEAAMLMLRIAVPVNLEHFHLLDTVIWYRGVREVARKGWREEVWKEGRDEELEEDKRMVSPCRCL